MYIRFLRVSLLSFFMSLPMIGHSKYACYFNWYNNTDNYQLRDKTQVTGDHDTQELYDSLPDKVPSYNGRIKAKAWWFTDSGTINYWSWKYYIYENQGKNEWVKMGDEDYITFTISTSGGNPIMQFKVYGSSNIAPTNDSDIANSKSDCKSKVRPSKGRATS